jgi:glutamyl-tRNA reductase
MEQSGWTSFNRLFVVGVNFKKADVSRRNKFALTADQTRQLYRHPAIPGLDHFFVLSTCNRTEVYGLVPCHYILLHLLKSSGSGSVEEINTISYTKEGDQAIEHFLTVASGLDSQIPGDYEVIAQIKSAFQVAKEYGRTNGYLERLVNQALQVSKVTKNTTSFSDGTLSVSYAVTQHIKKIKTEKPLNICLAGLGEIGILTLKNLLHYLPEAKIVLVNRDEEKAKELAGEFGVASARLTDLTVAAGHCQVLIVCTAAAAPLIDKKVLRGTTIRFIFDLSVPQNVAAEVYTDAGYEVMDVDTVSKAITRTMMDRQVEIPKVKRIVREKTNEFIEWAGKRDCVSLITKVQEKLKIGKPFSNKAISELYGQFASDYCAEPQNRKKILARICAQSLDEHTPESSLQEAITSLQLDDYAAHDIHHHTRKPPCFMANQCCHHQAV